MPEYAAYYEDNREPYAVFDTKEEADKFADDDQSCETSVSPMPYAILITPCKDIGYYVIPLLPDNDLDLESDGCDLIRGGATYFSKNQLRNAQDYAAEWCNEWNVPVIDMTGD